MRRKANNSKIFDTRSPSKPPTEKSFPSQLGHSSSLRADSPLAGISQSLLDAFNSFCPPDDPSYKTDELIEKLQLLQEETRKKDQRIAELGTLCELAMSTKVHETEMQRSSKCVGTDDAWIEEIVEETVRARISPMSCPNCGTGLTDKKAERTNFNDDDDWFEQPKLHEAPTGEVAFVFTDIQNSTFLWNQDWINMRKSLAIHNEIFRRLIYQHNGFEVKTEGDAFMITFSDPLDASRFCVEIQMRLCQADWPQDIMGIVGDTDEICDVEGNTIWRGLRVRMGIHLGEALCERDPVTNRMDYFGPVVNRAARVSGKGRGGEIVMSIAAFGRIKELLLTDSGRAVIHDGVVVNDLGLQKLKGFPAGPEDALFQLLPFPLRGREKYLLREDNVENTEGEEDPPMLSQYHEDKIPPPRGEVCIVCSDVEGSSNLWQTLPHDAARKAWSRHKLCLLSLLHEHKGYEVKAEGDAIMAVFTDTVAATKWALCVQLCLLYVDWPKELDSHTETAMVAKRDVVETTQDELPEQVAELVQTPAAHLLLAQDPRLADIVVTDSSEEYIWRGLRARMGLHFGTPLCESDSLTGRFDYFGPVIEKAARISSWAHGGETICGREVAEIIREQLDGLIEGDEVSVDCLGNKHLDGFKDATEIYRIQPLSLNGRVGDFNKETKYVPSDTKFDLELTERQQQRVKEMLEEERRVDTRIEARQNAHNIFLHRLQEWEEGFQPKERKQKLLKSLRKTEKSQMELYDILLPPYDKSQSITVQHSKLLRTEWRQTIRCLVTAISQQRVIAAEALQRQQSENPEEKKEKKAKQKNTTPTVSVETLQDRLREEETMVLVHQKVRKFITLLDDYLDGRGTAGETSEDTFIRQWLVECDSRCFGSKSGIVQHQVSLLLANTDVSTRKAMFAKLIMDILSPKDEQKFKAELPVLRKSYLGLLCKIFNRFRHLKRDRDFNRKHGARSDTTTTTAAAISQRNEDLKQKWHATRSRIKSTHNVAAPMYGTSHMMKKHNSISTNYSSTTYSLPIPDDSNMNEDNQHLQHNDLPSYSLSALNTASGGANNKRPSFSNFTMELSPHVPSEPFLSNIRRPSSAARHNSTYLQAGTHSPRLPNLRLTIPQQPQQNAILVQQSFAV